MPPELYPHQITGASYLRGMHPCAFLAFDPRCGKSATALTALPAARPPCLIVCPKSAIGVWQGQAAMWRPDYTFTTPKKFQWPKQGEIVCINYDRLQLHGSALPNTVLIYDEAHLLKSTTSLRYKRARVARNAVLVQHGRCQFLTGSAIENHPIDLWNLLVFLGLDRATFGTKDPFAEFVRCFAGERDGYGGYLWGIPLPEAVDRLKQSVAFARKQDVLPWLPKIEHEDVVVALDDARTRKLCDALAPYLTDRNMDFESLMQKQNGLVGRNIFEMRQAVALAKIPALLEILDLAEDAGERVLVLSAHRAPIDTAALRPGWAAITGSTATKKRADVCHQFRGGKLLGVAATIQAGCLSMDLSGADVVIFVDHAWNPGQNVQAGERVSGPNQTKPVLIRHMIADHPVDHAVNVILRSKETVLKESVWSDRVR